LPNFTVIYEIYPGTANSEIQVQAQCNFTFFSLKFGSRTFVFVHTWHCRM